CPLVSVLMSFGLIHWMTGEFGAGEIVLENGAMGGLLKGFQNSSDWLGLPEVTLQSAAALLIFGLYAVTMLVVLNGEMIERRDHRGFSERWRLFAALIASGALSAAGGVLWLVEHESAPIPGRLFDDMIIPAAALLAGGLYLGGSGRTLLACVLLPGALAVVTGWRQEVLSLRSDYLVGYPLQLGVLVVMVASARYAMTCAAATTRCRAGAMALAWSSSLGIAVFAASVWGDSPIVRAIFHVAGAGIWFLGGIGALLLRLTEPRRVRTDEFATAELLA
ncbi:MAG: hypothetical protein QGG25_09885, partial [Phycisphaerae bacterium]|nr:hypothetical protein [Phycisphaerae bacterium]